MSSYNSSYDYESPYSTPLFVFAYKVIVPVLFLLISIGGIVGNGLVIFCLLYFSNLKTVPNVYILNLAVIDLCFLMSLPFLAYQYIMQDWPFGMIICKFMIGVDSINQYASSWTLVAMSADRFMAVVYPLSSMQRRTRSCARMICTVVIIWSFVLSSVSWACANVSSYENAHYCTLVPINMTSFDIVYTAVNFSFGFVLPLAAIVFFYMSIFYIMQTNDFFSGSDAKTAAQRASKRVAVLTIAVIVVFFICWMPFYAVQLKLLLLAEDGTDRRPTKFLAIFHQMSIAWCYMNSVFNPFVYTFVGENFRKNMAKLYCCGAQNLNGWRSGRDSSSCTRSTMKLQPMKRHQTKGTYCPSDVTVVDASHESNNNRTTTT